MNGFVGVTVHIICPIENITTNKRTKEQKLKEIIAAICALLNSNGGSVVLVIDDKGIAGKCLPSSKTQVSTVIRILEQTMISIIGIQLTLSNIHFKGDKGRIVILVKKADSLITTNYNLYLPSYTQVVLVPASEPPEIIIGITDRKLISQEIVLGSHQKMFSKDTSCSVYHEGKTNQFKCLKSDASKRTTLADRITGKGNKFSCYVSAFANHKGGHIYYGINDDGVVEGQFITSENDKGDVTKKVEKAINKMIWPEKIGQPKRGEHWEIFFEPVVDEYCSPIPSTFVIVIYVAPSLGGVFTEEPECYEMVEGKVGKMSFSTWKRRVLESVGVFTIELKCIGTEEGKIATGSTAEPEMRLSENQAILQLEHLQPGEIPSTMKRITWHSTSIQNICISADNFLTKIINNGECINVASSLLEKQFPESIEVKLLILSKKVMVCYRSGSFLKAQELIRKYNDLLPTTPDIQIFDAVRLYIETALHRAKGDQKFLSEILPSALEKAELISPSLITAAIYLLAATVTNVSEFTDDDKESKVQGFSSYALSILALEHLKHVKDSPIVRADLEQKTHITLALFYLGCNTQGVLTKREVDAKSLEKAKSSVSAVIKLIDDGYKLNRYRNIQFQLTRSALSYRLSQLQDDRKLFFLKEAFNFSKSAEKLASENHLIEMLYWARGCMASYSEGMVRTHFESRSLKVPKKIPESKVESKDSGPQSPSNDNFLENKRIHTCEAM